MTTKKTVKKAAKKSLSRAQCLDRLSDKGQKQFLELERMSKAFAVFKKRIQANELEHVFRK